MKKWTVLMVAVGFILTASLSAQADSVLLPWIVKNDTVSTLVSVVNAYDPGSAKVRFHFMYWYKKTKANEQTELCEEVDFCAPTSFNDIVVFDAAGNFNGGSPLFGDTSVKGSKYTTVQGTSFALPAEAPRRAYLVITNERYTTEVCGNSPVVGFEDSIYAEAMIIDIATGGAWGYDGYNPRNYDPGTPRWWANFSDNATLDTDLFSQVVAVSKDRPEFAFLTIMPPSAGFITKMFVTPIGNDMVAEGNNTVISKLYCALPGEVAQYFGCMDLNGDEDTEECDPRQANADFRGLGGMFDSDENCISFDTVKPVICTDASTIDHYVSSAAWTIFVNSKAEGWAYLYLPDGKYFDPVKEKEYDSTRQATIGKLEYSLGAAQFDGNRIADTINNFIWLRGRTPQDAPEL